MSVEKIRELAEEILLACDCLETPQPTTLYDVNVLSEIAVFARDVWPGDYIYKTGAWRMVQSVHKLGGVKGQPHQVCISYHGNVTAQYLKPNEILRKRVR